MLSDHDNYKHLLKSESLRSDAEISGNSHSESDAHHHQSIVSPGLGSPKQSNVSKSVASSYHGNLKEQASTSNDGKCVSNPDKCSSKLPDTKQPTLQRTIKSFGDQARTEACTEAESKSACSAERKHSLSSTIARECCECTDTFTFKQNYNRPKKMIASKNSPILACVWWQSNKSSIDDTHRHTNSQCNNKHDVVVGKASQADHEQKASNKIFELQKNCGTSRNYALGNEDFKAEKSAQNSEINCKFPENFFDAAVETVPIHPFPKKSFSESYLKEYKQSLRQNEKIKRLITKQNKTNSKKENCLQISEKSVEPTKEASYSKAEAHKSRRYSNNVRERSNHMELHHKNAADFTNQRHDLSWNEYKKNNYFLPCDGNIYLETPLSNQNTNLLSAGKEFLAVSNGAHQVILYECSCKLCTDKAMQSHQPNSGQIHTKNPPKRNTKRRKMLQSLKLKNTESFQSDFSRKSSKKSSKLFAICYRCTDGTSSSSSSGGSDTENDDEDGSREREDYQEHGNGESDLEDSGGGDSGDETDASFDSAELFDNLNAVPEAKGDFDDDNDSEGPGMESDNSDSLEELRAMRCKKSRKTDDEDDEDDTDDDELSDWWDILTIYDE